MFEIINKDKKHRLAKYNAATNIGELQQEMFNKQGIKKANIDDRAVQQTQINSKHNKNTSLITSLLKAIIQHIQERQINGIHQIT